jgi:hypothetical protein
MGPIERELRLLLDNPTDDVADEDTRNLLTWMREHRPGFNLLALRPNLPIRNITALIRDAFHGAGMAQWAAIQQLFAATDRLGYDRPAQWIQYALMRGTRGVMDLNDRYLRTVMDILPQALENIVRRGNRGVQGLIGEAARGVADAAGVAQRAAATLADAAAGTTGATAGTIARGAAQAAAAAGTAAAAAAATAGTVIRRYVGRFARPGIGARRRGPAGVAEADFDATLDAANAPPIATGRIRRRAGSPPPAAAPPGEIVVVPAPAPTGFRVFERLGRMVYAPLEAGARLGVRAVRAAVRAAVNGAQAAGFAIRNGTVYLYNNADEIVATIDNIVQFVDTILATMQAMNVPRHIDNNLLQDARPTAAAPAPPRARPATPAPPPPPPRRPTIQDLPRQRGFVEELIEEPPPPPPPANPQPQIQRINDRIGEILQEIGGMIRLDYVAAGTNQAARRQAVQNTARYGHTRSPATPEYVALLRELVDLILRRRAVYVQTPGYRDPTRADTMANHRNRFNLDINNLPNFGGLYRRLAWQNLRNGLHDANPDLTADENQTIESDMNFPRFGVGFGVVSNKRKRDNDDGGSVSSVSSRTSKSSKASKKSDAARSAKKPRIERALLKA